MSIVCVRVNHHSFINEKQISFKTLVEQRKNEIAGQIKIMFGINVVQCSEIMLVSDFRKW